MNVYNWLQIILLFMQIGCAVAGMKTRQWNVWLPCALILMVGVLVLGGVAEMIG